VQSNKLDAALSSSGWKSVDLSQFRSFNNQSMNGLLEFEEIDASEFFGKSKAPKIITLQGVRFVLRSDLCHSKTRIICFGLMTG
jgi:hypothetical protein